MSLPFVNTPVRSATLCLVAAAALGLGGCSSLETMMSGDKIDYRSQAGKTSPLEVPPDLTPLVRDGRYLPQSGSVSASTLQQGAARPTNGQSVALTQAGDVRVERAGTQRWLVSSRTPEQLWPLVRQFWIDRGFTIATESADAGVLETDWAENRAKLPTDIIRNTIGKVFDNLYSTPERDKYRTRLEPGAEPGTTEIYVSHRGVMEVYINERGDSTVWQPRPADPELEAEMLRRLMVRLGADTERAKTLVAAQPVAERAQLVTADKGGTLQIYEGFDRAWRRVGLALDRVGFTVEDRDRSQGVYFVRYVDPEVDATAGEKKGGVLSKLLFFMPDDKPDPKAGQNQYRIHIKGEGKQSNVQVLTPEGGVDESRTAKRILSLLHEQLK